MYRIVITSKTGCGVTTYETLQEARSHFFLVRPRVGVSVYLRDAQGHCLNARHGDLR